jgi:hypothetical protein
MSEAAVCGGGYGDGDELPLQELLRNSIVPIEPFWPCQYVGFFESFLKYGLLQRQDVCRYETLLHSAAFLLLSADPNGLRGQPGGDLSSGKMRIAFTSSSNTTDPVAVVYSLYPEAAKRFWQREQFCTMRCGRQFRKYSPGSQLLLPREYVSRGADSHHRYSAVTAVAAAPPA